MKHLYIFVNLFQSCSYIHIHYYNIIVLVSIVIRGFRLMMPIDANMYIACNNSKRIFHSNGLNGNNIKSWRMQAKISFQKRKTLLRIPLLFIQGIKEESDDFPFRTAKDLVFKKTNLMVRAPSLEDSDSQQIIWSGVLVDPGGTTNRTGFATVIQSSDGAYVGSFTTEKSAYSIVTIEDEYQVRMTHWEDFPEGTTNLFSGNGGQERPLISNNTKFPKYTISERTTQVVIKPKPDIILYNEVFDSVIYRRHVDHNQSNNHSNDLPHSHLLRRAQRLRFRRPQSPPLPTPTQSPQQNQPPPKSRPTPAPIQKLPTQNNTTTIKAINSENTNAIVDLMVVITNRAMCEYAGQPYGCSYDTYYKPISDRIPLLEVQTNSAFASARAPVQIRIVGAVFPAMGYDPLTVDNAFITLRTDDYLIAMRTKMGADLVAMISGGPQHWGGCGKGMIDGITSVTAYNCLDGFSFTHELGHNFGGYHDRANNPKSHDYANAWQDPDRQFRTVMAYDCKNTSCPRIPYFSSDLDYYNNKPLGDAMNNNARIIRENAVKVANRMPSLFT